jgi:hypothetical protein
MLLLQQQIPRGLLVLLAYVEHSPRLVLLLLEGPNLQRPKATVGAMNTITSWLRSILSWVHYRRMRRILWSL